MVSNSMEVVALDANTILTGVSNLPGLLMILSCLSDNYHSLITSGGPCICLFPSLPINLVTLKLICKHDSCHPPVTHRYH